MRDFPAMSLTGTNHGREVGCNCFVSPLVVFEQIPMENHNIFARVITSLYIYPLVI